MRYKQIFFDIQKLVSFVLLWICYSVFIFVYNMWRTDISKSSKNFFDECSDRVRPSDFNS
jgi:hypothetical protein